MLVGNSRIDCVSYLFIDLSDKVNSTKSGFERLNVDDMFCFLFLSGFFIRCNYVFEVAQRFHILLSEQHKAELFNPADAVHTATLGNRNVEFLY